MPPDSEDNSGLDPSCVSAGEASRESSQLNERCAEDYAWMQEAASKFSARDEVIALIFHFCERCRRRQWGRVQRIGFVSEFILRSFPTLTLL